jgi:hypothetical protein
MPRFIASIGLSCLMFGCFGCGADDGRVEVYAVYGKVLVNGRPAEGARIVFYPTAEAAPGQEVPTPSATTDANGEYQLDSYEVEDGAPAGDFKVTVVWPEPPPPNATGIFDLEDQLGGRYSNPDTTPLTATVEEGGGEIPPFELK